MAIDAKLIMLKDRSTHDLRFEDEYEYGYAEYEYRSAEYEYRFAEYEYRYAEYEYRCAEYEYQSENS